MCRYVVIMVISLYTLTVCCVSAAVPSGVNLSDLASWDITIAENASPGEVYAAEEFQSHFAQASSIRLPIVSQSATGGQRHIFIGSSSAMRTSDVGFETHEFGQEDFRIVVRSDNIAIAGQPQSGARGTLYGVYTFLEDYAIDETIAQAGLDAFAEAMELAEEGIVRARVEKASICAYRAAIEPIWYANDKSSIEPALAERMRPLVKRFLDLCEKYGVTNASERSRIEDEAKRLRSIVGL